MRYFSHLFNIPKNNGLSKLKTKKPRKKRCKVCGDVFQPERPLTPCCSIKCAIELTRRQNDQKQKKVKTVKRKELMTRSQWYSKLQILVNQYVRWRDRDQPCCTCGTTNQHIKYDAGHFHTTGARPELRFELTNIHKQCSQKCNVYGSGMRKEYQTFIIDKYGMDHFEWLESNDHKSLKEQFPTWQDIEDEMKRYRQLLRDVGIKPSI